MERSSTRIPSLDGLRTISIALVIVGHFLHVLGVGEFSNLGNLGVRVFFVISGFLITGILVKEVEKTSTIDLLKFYFRRSMRIFPPYYFYLFVILIGGLAGSIFIRTESILLASFYSTNYINPSNWLVSHTWSLAVEEQFYLILPGLLFLLGIRRIKIVLILIIALGPIIRIIDFQLSGSEPIWVSNGFHANMDALAVGCLLAIFRRPLHRSVPYRHFFSTRIILVLPILIVLINLLHEHPHIFLGFAIPAMNLMIAFCLDWVVTNHKTAVGRLLNSPPMVMLGGMSYSIYLWQQPFFNHESPSVITQMPFNFIGLAVMTLFSYYVVERYSLKLRQRWEMRLFDNSKASNKVSNLPANIGEPIETAF